MKLIVFAAIAGLAMTQVALAQVTSPQQQPSNAQAQVSNAKPQRADALQQQLKSSLQQAGFTDISIKPEAFYIHAKDKSGNPVSIAVDPNSIQELTVYSASDQSDAAQTASNEQKGGMFTTVPSNDKLSSNLVGLSVYNNANQDIGTIKDVSINSNGVQAYVLAVGGFLGMGDHYVAVNPSALNVTYNSADKKWHATINATADQLKAAPEFKYTGAWTASKL